MWNSPKTGTRLSFLVLLILGLQSSVTGVACSGGEEREGAMMMTAEAEEVVMVTVVVAVVVLVVVVVVGVEVVAE
jgi:hypothetical protein